MHINCAAPFAHRGSVEVKGANATIRIDADLVKDATVLAVPPAPKQPYPPRPLNYPAHIPWGREVDALIPKMVSVLAERFDPVKVILFGSRARGEQRPDSDVDLLVVLPSIDEGDRRTARAAVSASIAHLGRAVPKDVLLATQADLDMVLSSNRSWCAHYHAVKEGVTLYAKRS